MVVGRGASADAPNLRQQITSEEVSSFPFPVSSCGLLRWLGNGKSRRGGVSPPTGRETHPLQGLTKKLITVLCLLPTDGFVLFHKTCAFA